MGPFDMKSAEEIAEELGLKSRRVVVAPTMTVRPRPRVAVGTAAPSPSLRAYEPSAKVGLDEEDDADAVVINGQPPAAQKPSELQSLVAQFKAAPATAAPESELASAQKADRMRDLFSNASRGLTAAFTRAPNAPAPVQSNRNVAELGQRQEAEAVQVKKAAAALDADPNSEPSRAVHDLIRTLHPDVAAKLGDRLGRLSKSKAMELFPHLEKYAELNRKKADDSAGAQKQAADLEHKKRELEFRMEDQRLDREQRAQAGREHRALMAQLATMRHTDAQAAKASANELKLGKDEDARLREHEKRIPGEASGMRQKLDRIDAFLAKPEFADDLPGVGPFTNVLPDAFVSDEGLELRQTARTLVDELLKMQSGAGVSDREREAKYAQYGMSRGAPEKMFLEGMKNLRNDVAKEMQKREAGTNPKIVEKYRDQGGLTSRDFEKGPAAQPVAGPKDQEALQWLQANQNDPGAEVVRAKLKRKGLIQ